MPLPSKRTIMPGGLLAIQLVGQLHRIPVDIRVIAKEYGIPQTHTTQEQFLKIAKDVGFKAKVKEKLTFSKLKDKYPLPAICLDPLPTEEGEEQQPIVVVKANEAGDKVLCFDPRANKTQERKVENLGQQWIIMTPRNPNLNVTFGLSWFYREILRYKSILVEVFTGSFVVQLCALSFPLFTQVILDKVIVHRSMDTLNVIAVAYAAVVLFELTINLLRQYLFTHTANKIDAKLGSRVFKHLFALPFVYFENRKVGDILARVREVETIRNFLTQRAVSVIIDLLFSVVFVVVMVLYSVKLTFVVLGTVAAISIMYLALTPRFRGMLEEKFTMNAKANSFLVESVTGINTVKALSVEGYMQQRWEDNLANYLKSNFSLSYLSMASNGFAQFFQRLMTIGILYFGVQLLIEGKLTVGQLIAFNIFAGQFAGPVLRLTGLWNEFQQTLLGIDRLSDILNQPTEIRNQNSLTVPKLQGPIEFKDVQFKYGANGPLVLNRLNLTIPDGTSVGIVGRSGSGKSTLAKLLQRLYTCTEGSIVINGVDIRHFDPRWLRQQIGTVLQDNYLFSGTVRDNIAMPVPGAPMELVLQASRLAGADSFIAEMPEGYDTMVGERGSTLSGGQKQRIAIARALITNPRILLFDEATSALDNESERLIRNNLHQIKQGRTTVMIAHRLSTVMDCDFIVVMDKGQIVELGSHHELLRQGGTYAHLFNQQQKELSHA